MKIGKSKVMVFKSKEIVVLCLRMLYRVCVLAVGGCEIDIWKEKLVRWLLER